MWHELWHEVPPLTRGAAFAAAVRDEFDLGTDKLELLFESERVLDQLDALHAVLDRDGLTVEGSAGQVVLHPAVSEARQARVVLVRLLGSLGLQLAEDAAPVRHRRNFVAVRPRQRVGARKRRWPSVGGETG
jgi:hypothetical protein